jgi:hypothetical protein
MLKLSERELDRLVKLCGLFSSHHPAEIAEAAKKADAFLRERGLTWPDVLGVPRSVSVSVNGADDGLFDEFDDDWRGAVAELLSQCDALTRWETEFVQKISVWHSISPKQRVVLQGIRERLDRSRL